MKERHEKDIRREREREREAERETERKKDQSNQEEQETKGRVMIPCDHGVELGEGLARIDCPVVDTLVEVLQHRVERQLGLERLSRLAVLILVGSHEVHAVDVGLHGAELSG